MGTGSFPWVKRPGRGVDHPPHMTPRLKNDSAIPLLPLWAFVAFSRESFTFTFTIHKKQFDNVARISVLYKSLLRKNFNKSSLFFNNPRNRGLALLGCYAALIGQSTLLNIPEEQRPNLHRSGSLKSPNAATLHSTVITMCWARCYYYVTLNCTQRMLLYLFVSNNKILS